MRAHTSGLRFPAQDRRGSSSFIRSRPAQSGSGSAGAPASCALTSPAARSCCPLRVRPRSAALCPNPVCIPQRPQTHCTARRGAVRVAGDWRVGARHRRRSGGEDSAADASLCARRAAAAADPAVRRGWHTVWPLYSRCRSSPFTLFR